MDEKNQSEQQKNLQVGTDLTKEATKTVGKKVAKETGKQVVKQIGKQAAARAGQAAGQTAATNVAGGIAGGVGTAGAGGAAGAAGGAAGGAGGVAAAESNPVGWIVTIIVIIIVLIILIIMMFSGGSSITCTGGVSADSTTASIADPVNITVNGCPDGVTYSWSEDASTPLGGSFSSQGQASTVYTPPAVTSATAVIIKALVCSDSSLNNCSSYSVTLAVAPATCGDLGGGCAPAAICGANGVGVIQGASDCVSPNICCNFGPGVGNLNLKFFCQYYRPYSNCNLTCSGSTTIGGTCTNPPTTCSIRQAGCVPTSVTMILSSFGVTGYNPHTTAEAGVSTGGINANSAGCLCYGANVYSFATTISKLSNGGLHMLSRVNIANSNGTFNTNLAQTYLNQGCLLLSAADMYWSDGGSSYRTNFGGPGGHATVLVGIDSSNMLTMYDPTFCTSDSNFTPRHISPLTYSGTNNSKSTYPVVSWWYVIPVCPL